MLQPITKDNFYRLLHQYSTTDLEDMVKRYPYLHQAQVLLAKRYYLENHPNYDRQLEKAATYTQDRQLFYELFSNDSSSSWPAEADWDVAVSLHDELYSGETEVAAETQDTITEDTLPASPLPVDVSATLPLIEETMGEVIETAEMTPSVFDEPVKSLVSETIEPEKTPEHAAAGIEENSSPVFDSTEVISEASTEEVIPPLTEELQTIGEEIITTEPEEELSQQLTALEQEEMAVEQPSAFSVEEPHTFSEWLKAFAPESEEPVVQIEPAEKQEEEVREDELEQVIQENITSGYVHELVEEQIHHTKGLEEYIKEQIGKRKKPAFQPASNDNEIDPAFVTETMAGVYEMQKKYAKAIRAYELLTLKYPEKSDLFAARINYLKNII